MKLKITHETQYLFDNEVFLEPHYLRFKPKVLPHRKLIDYAINIEPQPISSVELSDSESNIIEFCWFEGTTKKLELQASATVETTEYNPFGFILNPSVYNNVPFDYDSATKEVLGASYKGDPQLSKSLMDYGLQVLQSSGSHTVSFLTELVRQIHTDFSVIPRHTGAPYEPNQTYKLKEGSCRDLAWMSLHLLRHFGLAARFVSGYYYVPNDEEEFELHAWIETYLPGAGWFGLDPSQGIITGHNYIPVVASASHAFTMPVSGTFRGAAESKLSSRVHIEKLD